MFPSRTCAPNPTSRRRTAPARCIESMPMLVLTPQWRHYDKAFEAVGFEQIEAEHLRIRADLMLEVERLINTRGLTQAEAAKLFHVTQPRISDLTRGKIERFSIDTLVEILARAGVDVMVKFRRGKYVP